MLHLGGLTLCAMDFETTGLIPGWHDPIQFAMVPLDGNCRPLAMAPFVSKIRPLSPWKADPGAMRVHGIPMEVLLEAPEADEVAEALFSYIKGLPGRKVVPLAHSWNFESGFLQAWLGEPLKAELMDRDARDTKATATVLNDLAAMKGLPPVFASTGLGSLCKQLGVVNQGAHDALWDAVAEAEVYRQELRIELKS